MRQPESNNKSRELALLLTLIMILAVGAAMLGGAVVGFIVVIGERVITWFK